MCVCQKRESWLVLGVKADCLTRDLDLWVGCPLWVFFLARIYESFGENHGKLR